MNNTTKKYWKKKRAVTLRNRKETGGAQGPSALSHLQSSARTAAQSLLIYYQGIGGPIANPHIFQPLYKYKNLYTVRKDRKQLEFFETDSTVRIASTVVFYFSNNVCDKCLEFSTALNQLMSDPAMRARVNVVYVPIDAAANNEDYFLNNLSNIFMLNIKMDQRLLNKILATYGNPSEYKIPYLVIHDIIENTQKRYIDCYKGSVQQNVEILKTHILYGPDAAVNKVSSSQDATSIAQSNSESTTKTALGSNSGSDGQIPTTKSKDCGPVGPCGGSGKIIGGGSGDGNNSNQFTTYVASFVRKPDGSISKRMTFKNGKLLHADTDVTSTWMNNDDLTTITTKLMTFPEASPEASPEVSPEASPEVQGQTYGNVMEVNTVDEYTRAIQGPGLVVVDFFATWCGPCKQISPFVDALAKENPTVKFMKVNIDKIREIPISSVPTFKFFKHGQPVDEMAGADNTLLQQKVNNNK